MSNRITFSDQQLELEEIAEHISDVNAALKLYFTEILSNENKFCLLRKEDLLIKLN